MADFSTWVDNFVFVNYIVYFQMLFLLQFFRKNLKQIESRGELAMQEWYSYVTEMSLEECILLRVIFSVKFVLLLV